MCFLQGPAGMELTHLLLQVACPFSALTLAFKPSNCHRTNLKTEW